MIRDGSAPVLGALVVLFAVLPLSAQDLQTMCPNSQGASGGLWGVVADVDAGVALPGARLVATWKTDGKGAKTEVQTGLDGSYTLCYLPLEVPLEVTAVLGNLPGATLALTLTEPLTHQDVAFSLGGSATGTGGESDDRMWACFGRGESDINMQNARLIRCDANWRALDRCPREDLGRLQVTASGAGSGMLREALEQIIQQARRAGANALIRWTMSGHTISADAVKIGVDPSTCT